MIDITALFSTALAFFVVTVSPGPANIAVATVAMSSGRRAGLSFGFGLSLGLAFWGLIAAAGLGVVLQSSVQLLFFFKIVGGLYLIFLAYKSGRSVLSPEVAISADYPQSFMFLRGLMLNISNPKAVVAWMAALSMGLGTVDNDLQLFIATTLCMILGLINYTSHAIAFSVAGVMNVYKMLRQWIDGLVACLFAIAGIGLVRSAFSR